MKNKNYQTVITISLVIFMIALMALNGCKKTEPESSEDHTGHDHAMKEATETEAMDKEEAEVLIAKLSQEGKEVIEQTTCPVMGGKINKDVFVEYKGKKVYFCCPGCEGTFQADPEKYISNLPQFQE